MMSEGERDLLSEALREGPICPFCLGSLLAGELGDRPVERAQEILKKATGWEKTSLAGAEIGCRVCGGIIEDSLSDLVAELKEQLRGVEFRSFKAGTRLPPEVEENFDELRAYIDPPSPQAIKVTISRYVDELITREFPGTRSDPMKPDVEGLLDFGEGRVYIRLAPVLIFGRYRKLLRGIPQTRYGGVGEPGNPSVEELIGEPAREMFEGEDYKLHGAGREDVDARMLGTGRPFVLEVKSPKRRSADLRELERRINSRSEGKVQVSKLSYTDWGEVVRLKETAPQSRKVYRCLVEVEGGFDSSDLRRLEETFSGVVISQRTPKRVLKRRADIVRKKKVYQVKVWPINSRTFNMIVICDGGLYVKELISGDEERTRPSVASVLGKKAFCRELDVLAVVGY